VVLFLVARPVGDSKKDGVLPVRYSIDQKSQMARRPFEHMENQHIFYL